MRRPNLTVRGNAYVRRVLFEGTRCVGVEADVDGERQVFRAGETVLSAGALRSPQILMLSGVGPAAHLNEHGIGVVQNLAGVGSNLVDHPELSLQWDFKGKSRSLPGRGVLTSALNWTSEGSTTPGDLELLPFVVKAGDMMRMSAMAKNPVKTLGAIRQTSIKFVVNQAKAMRHPFMVIGLQQSESRGTVRLGSSDPLQQPLLDWNVLATESDRRRIREAIRTAAEVFRSRPMKQIGGRMVNLDAADLADDRSLDAWACSNIFSVGHPSCTCRMGSENDETAVVDQYGQVHGVQGLRVADTSIFPFIPSRGPNATAVMVGERISAFFD